MTEKEFINSHADDDPLSLRLRYSGKDLDFSLDDALVQIEARKKAAKKLSRFISFPDFKFPSVLASEQATDQRVAMFHSRLVSPDSRIIDLTSGLGIDLLTIAIKNPRSSVTAIEIEADKAECLRNNASLLGLAGRLTVVNADCREYIHDTMEHYDLLFADPARRSHDGGRCYAIKDCEPDVSGMMTDILNVADTFMFKLSPMLDITGILRSVDGITEVYAVSLKGELKEILVKGRRGGELERLSAVTVYEDGESDEFVLSPEALHLPSPVMDDVSMLRPGMFLYEPDPAIMKFGCFGSLASRFPGLLKLNVNTHLFVSEWEYNCFPGRRTRICSLPDKKELKRLKGSKVNVAIRNYPLSAELLKKKTGVRDGGDRFLYGARAGHDARPVLILTATES